MTKRINMGLGDAVSVSRDRQADISEDVLNELAVNETDAVETVKSIKSRYSGDELICAVSSLVTLNYAIALSVEEGKTIDYFNQLLLKYENALLKTRQG